MGVRGRLPLTSTAQPGAATLARALQPTQATQLAPRPAPDQPRSQRPWVGHLGTRPRFAEATRPRRAEATRPARTRRRASAPRASPRPHPHAAGQRGSAARAACARRTRSSLSRCRWSSPTSSGGATTPHLGQTARLPSSREGRVNRSARGPTAGATYRELAEATGLAVGTVYRIVRGGARVDPATQVCSPTSSRRANSQRVRRNVDT